MAEDGRLRRALAAVAAALWAAAAMAAGVDELTAARQEVFEFARKPAVVRDGDRATITFQSRGACDATVAVEDAGGRIVRHLACGVLGPNAPGPFQKNSLAQTILWDGKDDRGRYVDGPVAVRVSLGLKARFERTLFWSPQKRVADPPSLPYATPIMVAAPEGVYVYEGNNADHLRLFDHDGNYLRTIYPFPADKLDQVGGLKWATFPQDGKRSPLKWAISQNTLLTCSSLDYGGRWPTGGGNGNRAAALAVRGGRIALVNARLNRLCADGSTGGLTLGGPVTSYEVIERTYLGAKGPRQVGPRSAAISPDGKWLYMTGFYWPESWGTGGTRHRYLDVLARVPFDGPASDAPPAAFLGQATYGKSGEGEAAFHAPVSVACDGKGRIYVADYMNDRIQVFAPDGKFLRSIAATKPAHLVLDEPGDALYVFSWLVINPYLEVKADLAVEPTLTRYAPLEAPRPVGKPWPLPYRHDRRWNTWDHCGGTQYRVAVDPWAKPARLWVAGMENSWEGSQIRLYDLAGEQPSLKRDFGQDAVRDVLWLRASHFGRQRLYCNPRSGWLYVGEQHLPSAVLSKSIRDLVGIDPATGQVRVVPLPFDAEDLAFDNEGLAYLRTRDLIARYDPPAAPDGPWREVPFDYGEQRDAVGYQGFRTRKVISAVACRGGSWVSGQFGGMAVSPRGHIAMTVDIRGKLDSRLDPADVHAVAVRPYEPKVYPGRAVVWAVHVWDERGKVLCDDAIPGMGIVSSLHIDKDDNLYAMAAAQRILDGVGYLNDAACTFIKVAPAAAKVLSAAGVVPMGARPRPQPDVKWHAGPGAAWIENALWMHGGVGLDSHGIVAQIRACHCEAISHSAQDDFARSFLPEINRYDVLVLDSSGNTILRVGRYGNVDDGLPLETAGGPAHPRSIGGDEVAIVHGAYLATDTDRRLFVADLGNQRILDVALQYHASERVPLE